MIGFYNYTVILTYLSLISSCCGIIISLSGGGHPYIGVFFLLFCGLCDAFDGKVARTKKDRTPSECSYGIQIDSLSDLVAFGVLPASIGCAMVRVSPIMRKIGESWGSGAKRGITVLFCAILIFYVLCAMIRLAYYNVSEYERQKNECGVRKFYTGLPVTSASLIFPLILLLQYIIPSDIMPMYFGTILICAVAFISKIKVVKPSFRGTLIMVGIGAVEFFLILLARLFKC